MRTSRTCGQAIGQVSKWKRGEFSRTGCNSREMHVPKSGRSHTFWSLYGDKKARPTPLRAYGTHNDYSIFTYCTPRTWRPKAQTTTPVPVPVPDAGILFARLNWSRLPFWCAWVRIGALLRAVIVDLYCDSYCVPGPKSVCPCLWQRLRLRLLLRQSTSRFAQASPNKFHWASLHSGQAQLTKCAINRSLSERKANG